MVMLTIASEDIVEAVEVIDERRVRVVDERLNGGGVVELDPVPAGVAAALVDLVGEELKAHDGKGVVDDHDEDEDAE